MEQKVKVLFVLVALACLVSAAAAYHQQAVKVHWRVAEPNLQVSPSTLDFGEVAAGQNKTLSLQVRNVGASTLNVSISWPQTYGGWTLTVQPGSFILEPGEAVNVSVTLSVAEWVAPGDYDTTLFIEAVEAAF